MKITKRMVTEIAESMMGPQSAVGADWADAAMIHEVVGYALEEYQGRLEQPTIWHVERPSVDGGWRTMGFATGHESDVRAYFGDNPDMETSPLNIVEVPSGVAAHRANIEAKRDRLLAEAEELNQRLAKGGDYSK